MTLPIAGRGLCLRADVSFTALQAQFIGQILGQVTHLSVLEDHNKNKKSCHLPRVCLIHFQVHYKRKDEVTKPNIER